MLHHGLQLHQLLGSRVFLLLQSQCCQQRKELQLAAVDLEEEWEGGREGGRAGGRLKWTCQLHPSTVGSTSPYRGVDEGLNGIVVTGINGVQVDRVVDVSPHVVVILDVVVKALWGKVTGSPQSACT